MSRIVLMVLAISALAAASYTFEPNPCITVKCSAGFVCEAKDGIAGCVKAPTIEPYPVTLNACAATLCTVGSVCVEKDGVARCVAPTDSGNNNCTVKFEEWKQCASCEASCENKTPRCNKVCQPSRCMCRTGFFRSKDGQCVTENDCDTAAMTTPTPLTCKRANEEYRECASACEPTCKNKDKEIVCIAMCMPAACQCKVGFYRADNGDCVPADKCGSSSPQCKKNEQFLSCSSMCEPQCGQYDPIPCILMCGPSKCQCKTGFYRHSNGECMAREECEKNPNPVCKKKNQVFNKCSTACVQKCGEYEVRPCMALCGPPKCQCDRNFYLDNHGECVSRAECEAQSSTPKTPSQADCKPNQIFRECSETCEPKCGEYEPARACPAVCGPAKCQCDIGFYINSVGDCVSRADCELDQPITCANIDCVSGMVCKMDNGKPTCVKPAKDVLTCNTVKCAGGHRCVITPEGTPSCIPSITCANVRCAGPCADTPTGPSCGPRPQILPISVGPTANPVSPCARKNCGIAGRCIEVRGRAQCVPLFPATQKYDSFAAPPPVAEAADVSPRSYPTLPDSCDKVTCLGGGTCVMEEVKCISGPCKPVPKCKGGSSTVAVSEPSVGAAVDSGYGSVYQPYADNCGQLKCKEGEECTMERVPCFAAPCKKMAMCRPANTVCHKQHEVWDQCFHKCGPTCQNRDPICTEQCGPGGCICDTFYIRDEFSGECVRLKDCPTTLRQIPIEKPRALTIDSYADSPIGPVPPPPTCENFDCPVGQMCTLPPMQCPVPPCTRRPTCVKDPNFLPGDEIVPTCEGYKCADGEKCQLQEVQCIRAPCYPLPNCVPVMNPPICNLYCPFGMTCVLETVFCKKAPCPQRPRCILLQVDPVPQTCAAVTCLFGETCVEEPLPCLIAPCPVRAICRPQSKSCAKKNEIWSQCFTGCEATCQTRLKACTLQCGPGGCQCDSGYIRNEKTGDCVKESDCPNTCAANEKYDTCFHGCEATCTQPTPSCTEQCGPGGCRCADGFIRNPTTKKCIPQSSCRIRG